MSFIRSLIKIKYNQTNRNTNKQTNKQANKHTYKQTNNDEGTEGGFTHSSLLVFFIDL
jgi:hypothetical protein